MAKIMKFTDPKTNEVYEESYWRLVQISVAIPDKTAGLLFYGYKSWDDRNQGKQPVAAKTYNILGEAYERFFNADKNAEALTTLAYKYASEQIDMKREDDSVYSFFEGSRDA